MLERFADWLMDTRTGQVVLWTLAVIVSCATVGALFLLFGTVVYSR